MEIIETEVKPLPHLYWPLPECVGDECMKNLAAYQKKYYPRRPLHLPDPAPDIMEFDAAAEMSQVPMSENHMRST